MLPPMSTLLASLGIPTAKGYAPEHVPADADRVIVGNAALRDNVEAAEAKRRGLPVLSLPQAVRQYLLPGKTSIVITGTHGKTTTSALLSWLLLDSGRDPGFLIRTLDVLQGAVQLAAGAAREHDQPLVGRRLLADAGVHPVRGHPAGDGHPVPHQQSPRFYQ